MRHHSSSRKFGRTKNLRKALLRSLAEALIVSGTVRTTLAKAKELRTFIEPLITRGRIETVSSRRLLIRRLGTPARAEALVKNVSPRYKTRLGGYTRVVKVHSRLSDGSSMAIIELV